MDKFEDIKFEMKHKYIKRTGSAGKYRYFYRDQNTGRTFSSDKKLVGKKPEKTTYSGKYEGGYKGIGLKEANKRMDRVKGTKYEEGMSAKINGEHQSVEELGAKEFRRRVNDAISKDYPVVLNINGEKTGV